MPELRGDERLLVRQPDVVISVLSKEGPNEAKALELEDVARRFYSDRDVRIAIQYDSLTAEDVARVVARMRDLPG